MDERLGLLDSQAVYERVEWPRNLMDYSSLATGYKRLLTQGALYYTLAFTFTQRASLIIGLKS
jgi:hypothetical protein